MNYLKHSNKARLRHFLLQFFRVQCIWVAGPGTGGDPVCALAGGPAGGGTRV